MKQDKFFARQNYLEILNKRVKGLRDRYHQNIALLGEELIGKTSIILHFLSNFHDNRIVPIYLTVKVEEFEYFARRFISVLLYNFLSNSGIELREDLDFLINKSQGFIPKTIAEIKQILAVVGKKKKKDLIFTELFSLCDLLHQETGKSCVVVLDEFHNLEAMKVKHLYREWAKILLLQKNTMFLIASSAKFKAKKILAENLSLLFGNFEIIEVEPFDAVTSAEFLQDRLRRIIIDKTLRNFLISFAGGSPFYLEIVSSALVKSGPQDSTSPITTKEMVIEALKDILFEETGALNQRFHSYLRNLSEWQVNQDYLLLLYSISNGHNRAKDMMRYLHKQKKEVVKILNQLIELDVIEKNGDFYRINDRIFSFWLKFVHKNKTSALNFDAKAQGSAFREAIGKMIDEFHLDSKKAITERIGELLNLFENDGVFIGNKRLKLTNFREIKHLKFNHSSFNDGLLGRSSDCLWIIAIKHGALNEADIAEFSRVCKRHRQRIQRRICISPQEIDANVRLRALEEKVWTWNLSNINLLCDLFNKPAIIV